MTSRKSEAPDRIFADRSDVPSNMLYPNKDCVCVFDWLRVALGVCVVETVIVWVRDELADMDEVSVELAVADWVRLVVVVAEDVTTWLGDAVLLEVRLCEGVWETLGDCVWLLLCVKDVVVVGLDDCETDAVLLCVNEAVFVTDDVAV